MPGTRHGGTADRDCTQRVTSLDNNVDDAAGDVNEPLELLAFEHRGHLGVSKRSLPGEELCGPRREFDLGPNLAVDLPAGSGARLRERPGGPRYD